MHIMHMYAKEEKQRSEKLTDYINNFKIVLCIALS